MPRISPVLSYTLADILLQPFLLFAGLHMEFDDLALSENVWSCSAAKGCETC
jgi:hypothetical protein